MTKAYHSLVFELELLLEHNLAQICQCVAGRQERRVAGCCSHLDVFHDRDACGLEGEEHVAIIRPVGSLHTEDGGIVRWHHSMA